MPEKNDVSWNAMIAGYAQNGYVEEVMDLFSQMLWAGLKPNEFTYASIVNACTTLPDQPGKQIHGLIIRSGFQSDVSVANSLITMYGKYMNIGDACKMFAEMPKYNAVSWNAMIGAYAQERLSKETFQLFEQMLDIGIILDEFTFASILSTCAIALSLQLGKQVHARIIKSGFEAQVGNAIVDMYAKCLCIEDARQVFDRMTKPNIVSWNTMIVGCAWNDRVEEALKLYCEMQRKGIRPNEVTFPTALGACANLAALGLGNQIHGNIIVTGFGSDVAVANALVSMYAKCGILDVAYQVFDTVHDRDVISWNAIVTGYGLHGRGKVALELFEQMLEEGIKPDRISFLGVLSACNHAGLIDEGCHYFDSMTQNFYIMPAIEHYACVVDLHARAGCLDAAKALIDSMPFEPDAIVWSTLLNASRIHGDSDLGKRAAENLLKLEPKNPATYVQLSNIYAASGRWDDAAKVRKMMKDIGVKKEPGCSWIEVRHRTHAFVVGDRSHPQSKEIYAMLEKLTCQIRNSGYVPDTSFAHYDME